tara:strand:+ start:25711 stop:26898 length:1188 start_codon:yes stop_codon:yes gene_type:complete
MTHKINFYYITILFLTCNFFYGQNLLIDGTVLDENNFEIPFAAVGILKKNIGTTSTSEGTFSFIVSSNEIQDTLEISSLGFKTFKIKVKDYLEKKNKLITLSEQLTQLDEVVVKAPINYIERALKSLKNNSLSNSHQLNILYRRWDVEEEKCAFFIEQFIKAIDKGPNSNIIKSNIENQRKSADYRFVKNEAQYHPLQYTEWNNPLRRGIRAKDYKWKKIKNSSYDNEDVLIFEGINDNFDKLKLIIGFESYKIYQVESDKNPKVGKSQIGLWIYKKNSEGKLYLSYHKREWKGARELPENVKRAMISSGKKVREFYPVSFRHELIVTKMIENKQKFDKFMDMEQKDMSLYDIAYNQSFWHNFSLPPKTNYYKKNILELESRFGVKIENQFKYSN